MTKKNKTAAALYLAGLLSGVLLSCWLHTPAAVAPAPSQLAPPQQAQADAERMNKSTEAWLTELESRLDQ